MTASIEEDERGARALACHKIVALIPAYNEERFIGSVVLAARRYVDVVVVVDDGSTDGTARTAEAAGAVVVRHERNRGKGVAFNTGFRRARELGADCVVTLDADGQHMPEEATLLVAPVLEGQADVVVGSRYLERTSEVPRGRVWGHHIFNFVTRQASGVLVTDSQSGFRAFSARALGAISFLSQGFSVESEMQFLVREHNLTVVEVPITIRYCDKPKRPLVAHGLMVLSGVFRLAGQYRPLLFFGLPGLLVLLVGVGWGLLVVNIYRATNELALGYAMISVLLSTVGVTTLFTGVMLHSVRGLLIDLTRAKDGR